MEPAKFSRAKKLNITSAGIPDMCCAEDETTVNKCSGMVQFAYSNWILPQIPGLRTPGLAALIDARIHLGLDTGALHLPTRA